MGVVPKEVKGSGGGGTFLKASSFEGEGLTLKVLGFEKVRAGNADYGANEKDFLFTSGRLQEGETFRYSFEQDGQEVVFDSKSATFFISFSKADPEVGDTVKIVRSGSGRDTEYLIEVV